MAVRLFYELWNYTVPGYSQALFLVAGSAALMTGQVRQREIRHGAKVGGTPEVFFQAEKRTPIDTLINKGVQPPPAKEVRKKQFLHFGSSLALFCSQMDCPPLGDPKKPLLGVSGRHLGRSSSILMRG